MPAGHLRPFLAAGHAVVEVAARHGHVALSWAVVTDGSMASRLRQRAMGALGTRAVRSDMVTVLSTAPTTR